MNVKLTFSESDFQNYDTFEKAVKRQLGNDVYVGTDSLCLFCYFPDELKNLLSVMTTNKTYPETFSFQNFTFSKNDLQSMKDFEKAVNKQGEKNVYVWHNALAYYFDFPLTLLDLRKPNVMKFLKSDVDAAQSYSFDLASSLPDQKRK